MYYITALKSTFGGVIVRKVVVPPQASRAATEEAVEKLPTKNIPGGVLWETLEVYFIPSPKSPVVKGEDDKGMYYTRGKKRWYYKDMRGQVAAMWAAQTIKSV